MMEKITCPECLKRLGDEFSIKADKIADLFYWDDKEEKVIIVPGTKIVLTKNWKQEIVFEKWENKKPTKANWKKDHSLRLWSGDYGCATVYNNDNNRAGVVRFCKLPEDIYQLEGDGAKAREEQDRVRILELQLEKETKLRKEAEREVRIEKNNRTADQLVQRLQDTGIKSRAYRSFHTREATGILLDFEVAEIVAYNIEIHDDIDWIRKRLESLEFEAATAEKKKLDEAG